jgi:hypothetical protein
LRSSEKSGREASGRSQARFYLAVARKHDYKAATPCGIQIVKGAEFVKS